MKVDANNFVSVAQIAVNDPDLQEAVSLGTYNGYSKRLVAMFSNGHEHGEAMRQQAAAMRRRAIQKLPDLLELAEKNMTANGIKVLWAETAEDVRNMVLDIAKKRNAKLVAKSKSMISEEVALNHAFEENGIEVVETDLGEYIIQLNKETPSHIVMPVMHRTKREIRDLFMRELNMPFTDDAAEMTAFIRKHLRQVFVNADIGISGGNFIIAESGSLCLVTNEGNGRMVTAMPKVHIGIVGIEKVIETIEDYATLTQILPRSATGQQMTVYMQMINGPRREDEPDGPDEVYVILVDNGRSKVYATKYAEALTCIRCGACLNACPVYQVTGGHAYGWVYSGPIGAVITPALTGLENATPLPQASSLCGKCKQVCPVDIDIPRMLLDLRHELVEKGMTDKIFDVGLKAWSIGNRSPKLFIMGGAVARFGTRFLPNRLPGPLGGWTKYRDFPQFAPKPFRELWKERKKGKPS
mgnify:CR=1 FL=1